MYFLLSTFLVNYAKKLEKNPNLSLTYTEDQGKRQNINTDFTEKVDNEQRSLKHTSLFFLSY
jgi:uncharacterized ion transporter superfamily protein YfcC